jgi:hypothetical protein
VVGDADKNVGEVELRVEAVALPVSENDQDEATRG